MFDSYNFVIRIGGRPYELSKGFRFTRDMKLMASAFEITVIDPDQSLISAFRPGKEALIEVDGKILAKAFLNSLSIDDTNGHVFTYSGRDRAGDLVDCSALFSNGGMQRDNITLDAAVKDVLKPFNIGLTVAGPVGAAFKTCVIQPGETAFDFIDRLCRYRALFPLADGMGGLILTKAGSVESGGTLIVGEDGNVISRQGTIDHSARFSEITVKGSGGFSFLPEADAKTLSGSEGRAKDPDITRYRPLILQAESEGFDLDLKARAEWEVRHRRFIGTEITYTVPGWEAAKGSFWKINTTVPVRDPQLNIARTMLIKTVTLSRTEDGTTSQISVAPAEAYDLPAVKESGDDALWGGGA